MVAVQEQITCDNLAKRRNVDDKSCIFCFEPESIHHLFFDCCVAKILWSELSKCLDHNSTGFMNQLPPYANKKHLLTNVIIAAAALWCVWKLRSGSHLDRTKAANAIDLKNAKMKINVHWSGRGETDGGDTEDRTKSGAASLNRLAPFQSTNIRISAFEVGLQCCD